GCPDPVLLAAAPPGRGCNRDVGRRRTASEVGSAPREEDSPCISYNKSPAFRIYTSCRMIPEIIGGAALGAAGFAGYHSLAWRSQFYGRTFIGTPGVGKKLALTYDDGPNDPHTLHLLDVLAKHDVKGTFFLIGKFV